jgi:hypothetical protein
MKPVTFVIGMIGLACTAVNATTATTDDPPSALHPMPKSLEIRFALSALPAPLRANATVYVLDTAKGYVLEHVGTNGQSCFVSRTEWKFADYRNDIFDATCYDSVGTKNHMQVLFDVARLRAQGVAPHIMKQRIQEGFNTGKYHAPEGSGFSYMTAPLMRTYMSLDPNDKSTVMTMSMPHVMYYAPNVTDAKVGGLGCPPCAPYPFAFESGPHGYIIQRLGDQEAAKIVADESALVRELCQYLSVLCLSPPPSAKP